MASDIAIASPDAESGRRAPRPARRGAWPLGSRLGRLIILLNLLGLAILVGGALVLNEIRQGLIQTRLESLELEGQVIAKVIDEYATVGEPEPTLDQDAAASVVGVLSIPSTQRARLFDSGGHQLADSSGGRRPGRCELPAAGPQAGESLRSARRRPKRGRQS